MRLISFLRIILPLNPQNERQDDIMTINGISGQNYGSKSFMMDMGSDATSKNLQSQIANAQKQMQELGSNKDMSPEAKMEKRKEIQEQINELQNQLRQHQIEQRKENLQRSTSSMEDMLGGDRQNSQPSAGGAGMSGGNMQAILSADSAMTQVKAQGKARAQVKGETKVLKSEIRQDGARGGNVEKKQEQLEKTEARAQNLENVIVELSGKGLAAFKEYKENNRLSENSSRKIPDEYINQLDHLHVLTEEELKRVSDSHNGEEILSDMQESDPKAFKEYQALKTKSRNEGFDPYDNEVLYMVKWQMKKELPQLEAWKMMGS